MGWTQETGLPTATAWATWPSIIPTNLTAITIDNSNKEVLMSYTQNPSHVKTREPEIEPSDAGTPPPVPDADIDPIQPATMEGEADAYGK